MKGKLMEQCGCSRRTALKAAAAAAGLAMTGGLTACGDLERLEEDVSVDLTDYPDLAADGGIARISPNVTGFGFAILVLRRAANDYIAMSSECTHLGCEVEKRRTEFFCDCPDSSFSFEGSRLAGPARDDLKRFGTRLEQDRLVILADP
jgi:Rieske Fe-S protein